MSKYGTSYSREEIDYIRKNWKTSNDEDIAMALDRTVNGICKQRWNMGLSRSHPIDHNAAFRIRKRMYRLRMAVRMSRTINRMKALIWIIQNCSNEYQRQKYIPELKKLSGL